jgi:ATP-binding cassette subfamily C protein
MRRVALEGEWWRQNGGPLLAFKDAEERPVALLQKGTAAYTLVDPVDGTRQPVTRETASELAAFGYTFYAPFPDRPLGAWDLLRYSLRELRGDLLRVLLMGAAGGILGALVPIATKQIVDLAILQAEGNLAVALAWVSRSRPSRRCCSRWPASSRCCESRPSSKPGFRPPYGIVC